jgi:MFS family permease
MGNSKYVIADFDTFIKVMNVILPICAMITAPIVGTLVQSGRRSTMMITSGIFAAGCMLSLIFNFFTIFIGRVIMGGCIGAYLTLVPLMVCELSPGPISGPLGVVGQVQGMTGVLISSVLQFAQPYENDTLALQSLMWKITLGLPVFVCGLQILLLYFVFDFDSPRFHQIEDEDIRFRYALKRQYYIPALREDETTKLMMKEEDQLPFKKITDISWGEVFSTPYYRAMLVGVLFAFFHQASGINSITFVSNQLFTRNVDQIDMEYYSRAGSFVTGLAGILAAITGFILSHCFGRRFIILFGLTIMIILLGILSNTALLGYDEIGKVCNALYAYAFNASLGSILWLYVSETNGPKSISVAAVTSSASTLLFMLVTGKVFDIFTEVGIYFNLFFFQVTAIGFMYIFLKETRGCKDKEKLYWPEDSKKEKEDEPKELDDLS